MRRLPLASAGFLLLMGCGTQDGGVGLTQQELMNPESCQDCHPKHYREWAGSMHAYASDDPVFLAMNRRGQEEAQLGDFCVKCHAPMAVRTGATIDGLNLEQLPQHLKGVTCYFCHNAVGLGNGDLHNNPLELANDNIMRAALSNAVTPAAHEVAYSRYHDRNEAESAAMCGACHDITTPKGVHLERTFKEYTDSALGVPGTTSYETCQGCHMYAGNGVAADTREVAVPGRQGEVHEHLWPGVDVALTPFPQALPMRVAIEQCMLPNGVQFLRPSFTQSPGTFEFILESASGHNVPSGASQDRRMWLEVTSYDAQGRLLFQSGAIADDAPESSVNVDETWTFHDKIFNELEQEVHMFWEAAPSGGVPAGVLPRSIPAAKAGPGADHVPARRPYSLGISPGLLSPARALIRLRMRPMGHDVLQDLVQSGHLDPSIINAMPTYTMLAYEMVWAPSGDPDDFDWKRIGDDRCDPYRYQCLLEGGTTEACGVVSAGH